MATADERLRILQRIQDREITAEEGARLLAGAPAGEAEAQPASEPVVPASRLRVRVTDPATGKLRANVTIPVGLVDAGLKMGARFSPGSAGLDLAAVQAAIQSGLRGKILEAEDSEANELVEIFLE